MTKALVVVVDGVPMPDEDARAFWQRFSEWMEEHRGDLGGFAVREGFVSVHPGVENGRPILRVSRTAEQRPYAPVAQTPVAQRSDGSGGSPNRHENRRPDRSQGWNRKK
jgi:hypothetical protein